MRLSTVRHSRAALAPLALAGVLTLTACSGSSSAGSTETPKPEKSASATPEAEPTETPEPTEEPLAGAECLEGTWGADLDSVKQAALEAFGNAELAPTMEITGDSTTTFDGSAMTAQYNQQSMTMSMDVEGQSMVIALVLDGTVAGTYTATDTTVTVNDVDTSGFTFTTSATVDGEVLEMPADDDLTSTLGAAAGGTSAYTCDATTLTLTPEGQDAVSETFIRR